MFRKIDQGEKILKTWGVDTSKLRLAKRQYVTNVCYHFQNNPSKTVGGVCNNTKSVVFFTKSYTLTDGQTKGYTDRQTDRLIPVYIHFEGVKN